jgi:hypothetical protein
MALLGPHPAWTTLLCANDLSAGLISSDNDSKLFGPVNERREPQAPKRAQHNEGNGRPFMKSRRRLPSSSLMGIIVVVLLLLFFGMDELIASCCAGMTTMTTTGPSSSSSWRGGGGPRNFRVVGGGLAGMAVTYHLLQLAAQQQPHRMEQRPIRIEVVDPHPVGMGGASAVAGGYVLGFFFCVCVWRCCRCRCSDRQGLRQYICYSRSSFQ